MDREVYQRLEKFEDTHWWFVARRKILAEIFTRMIRPASGACILEAGCGTGGNLAMLQKFGAVDAFEYDSQARAAACTKSGLTVSFGALPDNIPFVDTKYDVIALFDVLEHIEPDVAALTALRSYLSPGGVIFVTVPAFSALWSHHDVTHHHHRRYSKTSLELAAGHAGLKIERSFYFNMLLLPIAIAVRGLKALSGHKTPDDDLPSPWLNNLLTRIYASERNLIGRVPMPFGLSLGAILVIEGV